MRSTPQERQNRAEQFCFIRNQLLQYGPLNKRQLFELFFLALDGDEPDEFPELAKLYYRGRADPVRFATKMLDDWMFKRGMFRNDPD